MKKYFNSREKAMKHLDMRRTKAFSRIEKRGDKVTRDDSCVLQKTIWRQGKTIKVGELEMVTYSESSRLVWFVMLAIYTEQMLNELTNYGHLDPEVYLENEIKN
jgi:hypothetical protein